ncbi:MAG: hypothetical protein J6L62_05265 [Clostridia bacterium]|nr:hypothetical protein [Clostridia bacterium]
MKKIFSALLVIGILLTSTFTAFAATAGDVNSDGNVNSSDALLILQHAVGANPANFNQNLADMNSDGRINSSDALIVLQIAVGLIEPEQPVTPTLLRDEVILKVIKDRKFTISMTVVGEGEEIPVTLTMDGDNSGMAMSVEGIESKVITLNGKSYMAFNYMGIKMYMETEDGGMGSLMSPGSGNETYVKTTTVTEGNKTYTVEEFKSPEGTVIKYYFEGEKWVRQEVIEGNIVSICEIHELKDSVDKSIFDLKGYIKIEEDFLNGLA